MFLVQIHVLPNLNVTGANTSTTNSKSGMFGRNPTQILFFPLLNTTHKTLCVKNGCKTMLTRSYTCLICSFTSWGLSKGAFMKDAWQLGEVGWHDCDTVYEVKHPFKCDRGEGQKSPNLLNVIYGQHPMTWINYNKKFSPNEF